MHKYIMKLYKEILHWPPTESLHWPPKHRIPRMNHATLPIFLYWAPKRRIPPKSSTHLTMYPSSMFHPSYPVSLRWAPTTLRCIHQVSSAHLTQNPSVDEVDKTEVLQQVVLYGGPRQENPAPRPHSVQCPVGLVLWVLQPMSLSEV